MFEEQLQGCPRALLRSQRIHHNPAALATNEGSYSHIETTRLIDARDHLEQSVDVVKLSVSPQGRVHRIRRRLLLTLKSQEWAQIPDDLAGSVVNHVSRQRFDQTPLGILEILAIGERVFLQYALLRGTSSLGRGRGDAVAYGNRGHYEGAFQSHNLSVPRPQIPLRRRC